MSEPTRQRGGGRSSQPGRKPQGPVGWLMLGLGMLVAAVLVYVRHMSRRAEEAPVASPQAPSPRVTLAEEVLSRARRLMAAGQHAPAADLMEAFVRQKPADVEVRPLLAEAQMLAGQADRAERTCDRLLELAPRMPEALWLKGRLVRQRGGREYPQYLQRAAEGPSAGAEIWARCGSEFLEAGQADEAEKHLRRALDAGLRDSRTLGGLGRLALRRDDAAVAEQLLAEGLALAPGDVDIAAALAETQMRRGAPQEAERTLRRALAVGRGPAILLAMGHAVAAQGRWLDAAAFYSEAADHSSVRAAASLGAAQCHYKAGQYGLAMKFIDIAVQCAPQDAEVQRCLHQIEDARFGASATGTAPASRPGE